MKKFLIGLTLLFVTCTPTEPRCYVVQTGHLGHYYPTPDSVHVVGEWTTFEMDGASVSIQNVVRIRNCEVDIRVTSPDLVN